MIKPLALASLAVLLATAPAFAHLDPAAHGSFAAGFSHPLFGLDHILAMIAVGLWAASIGVGPGKGSEPTTAQWRFGRALWAVPLAFVATMAIGFGAAVAGMPLPFVEPVILASVIVIGIMIALALPMPTPGVAAVVAFFALFHGHAHGGELGAAGALDFALGFVLATALLHAAGIVLGVALAGLFRGPDAGVLTRVAGALTGLGGLWLAIGG